jgi:predicted phosphodiesterase
MIIKHIPENDNITIYPIADLHVGAKEFMQDKWIAFKKKIKNESTSYIVLNGDLINNATRNSVSNIFEETMRPADQKKWVARELDDIKDKILCVVSGNHERRSEKDADDNPAYDICCKLDIEDLYRENMAFVKLQLGNLKSNGLTNPVYTIAAVHGAGGGIYTGAAVNRNERFGMVIDGLDILIVGHTHKGSVTKPQKIYIDKQNNKISFKQFVTVSCTSWLSFGGYAMQKMLLPASNDIQKLYLHGREKVIETIW